MTYDIFKNTGSLDQFFRFDEIGNEKISLKYIDNTFLRNKRLSVQFDYFQIKRTVIENTIINNYIKNGDELILGVTFFTGVELKRELIFKIDFEGIIINFLSGSHMLGENVLLIDTSKNAINSRFIEIEEINDETKKLSREPILQIVQDKVWNRDGGRCVKCGSNEKLEFDHIIPFSKGGANTYRNLQLLCESCNRKKSNKIG